MRFIQILLEDYKTAAKAYEKNGNSPEKVKTILAQFRKIQPRISDINLKNIDWWAKNRDFGQLEEYVKNFEGIPTKSQIGKKTGRSYTVTENNEWLIVIPLDKDASCFHGKTTDWCTTKPFQSYYEDYFYDKNITLIYCLQKQSGNKWAMAAHKRSLENTEYFDVNDEPLDKNNFEKQTGLNVDTVLGIAFGKNAESEVTSSREKYSKAIKRIQDLMGEVVNTKRQNIEIESLLWYTKNKNLLRQYMSIVGPANFNKNLEAFAINSGIENAITYIKNPSERIQMLSAKQDGFTTLNYLLTTIGEDNISDEVKRECVYELPSVINRLKNQSEELKRIAVERGLFNLSYLHEPVSDELKMMAIKKDGRAIGYIKNPSEEMQIESLNKYGANVSLILKNGIIPSQQVILSSLSNSDADYAFEMLVKNNIKINDEAMITAIKNADEPKIIINICKEKNIPISLKAEIESVRNDPLTIYNFLIYHKGKVNEAVQMVCAKESGRTFIGEMIRYFSTVRILPEISNHAIEESFKNMGYLTLKTMQRLISFKNHHSEEFTAFPTYEAFKNAADNLMDIESNSDTISLLSLSFQYPEINEKLLKYISQRAKDDGNGMLTTLIDDYKRENDLDNLQFEPESNIT